MNIDEGMVIELPPSVIDKVAAGIERIGVALLVQSGTIDIDEARLLIGMDALTSQQKTRLHAVLRWIKTSGVVVPLGMCPYWYEAMK